MCLAQGPQRSDAGEALTRSPLVSSQAVYHWATGLPYWSICMYSKTCLKKLPLKKKTKLDFKTDYCLMQVKSIAECSKGSILQ